MGPRDLAPKRCVGRLHKTSLSVDFGTTVRREIIDHPPWVDRPHRMVSVCRSALVAYLPACGSGHFRQSPDGLPEAASALINVQGPLVGDH